MLGHCPKSNRQNGTASQKPVRLKLAKNKKYTYASILILYQEMKKNGKLGKKWVFEKFLKRIRKKLNEYEMESLVFTES